MRRRQGFHLLFFVAFSIVVAEVADARELTVYLAPALESAEIVAIEGGTQEEHTLGSVKYEADRRVFRLKLDTVVQSLKGKALFARVDLMPRVGGKSHQGLSLRIPRVACDDEDLYVYLVIADPRLSPETIEEFWKRGLQGDKAYLTYFEAKNLYGEMSARRFTDHALMVPIAYWYFAAAFNLAKRGDGVIVMDPESLAGSRRVLDAAKVDPNVAAGFRMWKVSVSHWEAELAQARRLEWQGEALVREVKDCRGRDQPAVAVHNLDFALELSEQFEAKYRSLTFKDRTALSRDYGVSFQRFEDDQDNLRTLLMESSNAAP